MGIALSGNGSVGRTPTGRRDVYMRADSSGVIIDRGTVREYRPARIRPVDSRRPVAGLMHYDAVPRYGSRGSRVSVTSHPSHDQRRPRPRFAGLSAIVATVVVTVGIVVGLDALANLAAGESGATDTVQVQGTESFVR
ncbi:hypothetical protein AB4Z09_00285 [Rhodococcus sp. TAF43]|uniref:hypothetical protein n=1 Tax=unclassified Rhodococcus (in: high G+C Gram-positive bacteria) TaxID=192944 RepID=UPI000E0C466E|nr:MULTISPECIES: hypothetical protein [unclassified Rhodococcus (in: high G+C Gram-positive bacteria)]QKT11249.1 hypothetical protein HUN07_11400 [Rhodococcus sp. W8901]RDI31528.1 hypothetical protein DEU38_104242 [Rhodococcus sp. AG1013]